jgi:hypothetical protein
MKPSDFADPLAATGVTATAADQVRARKVVRTTFGESMVVRMENNNLGLLIVLALRRKRAGLGDITAAIGTRSNRSAARLVAGTRRLSSDEAAILEATLGLPAHTLTERFAASVMDYIFEGRVPRLDPRKACKRREPGA